MQNNIPYRAFTLSYNGIAAQICSEATVIYNSDKFQTTQALWDTGATLTCISARIVQELNLIRTGLRTIQTPSGSKTVNTYLVNIQLPNHVLIVDIPVCDSDIGDQGIDVLIGMDIISRGDLSLTQINGKTTFSFCIPPIERIDYVKKANLLNLAGRPHGKGKRKH